MGKRTIQRKVKRDVGIMKSNLKYHNPTTNQTATDVDVDTKSDIVTYKVDGKEIKETWHDFIKKFKTALKG